jgi:hypothetical protein
VRALITSTVAGAAAAATLLGVVSAQDGGSRLPRTSLSVFNLPQRRTDRLPVTFIHGPISAHFRNADSRRVGRYRGTTWYVVPGRHHLVCLAGIKRGQTFGPCTDMRALAYQAILIARATGKLQGGPNYEIAGLANDGLTRVAWRGGTSPIRRNAFFLTVPKSPLVTLRLSGPDVPTHVVQLHLGPVPRKPH